MSVASAVRGPGVSGLADVAAEDGPSESAGAGELGLGDDDDGANGLPVISVNAAGLGFHELRWKLFFLRTLARYAARIAAVAWEGVRQYELAEAMLGVRPCEVIDVVVISSRGRVWCG